MPSNIEIKARVGDWNRTLMLAEQLAGHPPERIHQEDTFFVVGDGHLKLRNFSDGSGELICYKREGGAGPRRSEYLIHLTACSDSLRKVLSRVLQVRGIVEKERLFYRVGQTRVHLDAVVSLGQFIELEVVLLEGQSQAQGIRIARELMSQLEISEGALLHEGYIDLLESQRRFNLSGTGTSP
jgi:predicted adenylyl cyclase CyaB